MMVMVMVTMMVNVCDDDCYLMVMKVILVKEVMSCDVSPVAMFLVETVVVFQEPTPDWVLIRHPGSGSIFWQIRLPPKRPG